MRTGPGFAQARFEFGSLPASTIDSISTSISNSIIDTDADSETAPVSRGRNMIIIDSEYRLSVVWSTSK